MSMTEEEWEETYKPIHNKHLPEDEEGAWGGTMFETYGAEIEEVIKVANTDERLVWTWVEGDEGTYLVNGYQMVHRLGYFICEVPYEGDNIEIKILGVEEEMELDAEWSANRLYVVVEGTPTSAEDADVPGAYAIQLDSTKVPENERGGAALDILHTNVAIETLDDFTFVIYDQNGNNVVDEGHSEAYSHEKSGSFIGQVDLESVPGYKSSTAMLP